MHILNVVALAGLTVLVVCWLLVSFGSPSPRRRIFEWLGTVAMYVALLAFFGRQLHEAIVGETWIRSFAFGLLVVVFSIGLGISGVRMLRALGGGGARDESGATH